MCLCANYMYQRNMCKRTLFFFLLVLKHRETSECEWNESFYKQPQQQQHQQNKTAKEKKKSITSKLQTSFEHEHPDRNANTNCHRNYVQRLANMSTANSRQKFTFYHFSTYKLFRQTSRDNFGSIPSNEKPTPSEVLYTAKTRKTGAYIHRKMNFAPNKQQ